MECVNEGWIKFDTEKDKNRFIHLVRDIAPPAQPEIVRCRDCEYNLLPATSANANCKIFYGMTDQNGFCHMAERREVNTNG